MDLMKTSGMNARVVVTAWTDKRGDRKMQVKLNNMKEVQEFVNRCSMFEEDVYLSSGRYVINGKSLMGILSLDLSRPINVVLETDEISTRHVFAEYMVGFMS